jgi:hypothetical protein
VIEELKNPLCKCGCGEEVKNPWNIYIAGHQNKNKLKNKIVNLGIKKQNVKVLTESSCFENVPNSIKNYMNYDDFKSELSEIEALKYLYYNNVVPDNIRKNIFPIIELLRLQQQTKIADIDQRYSQKMDFAKDIISEIIRSVITILTKNLSDRGLLEKIKNELRIEFVKIKESCEK